MTSPAAMPIAPRRHAPLLPAVPAVDAPLARRILREGLLLGVSADLLLRASLVGAALPLWVALAALAFVALTWTAGRRVPREASLWLCCAVLFAASTAWRDAGFLIGLGLVATVGALLMAAIATYDQATGLLAARVRDLAWAAVRALRRILPGWAPLAFREAVIPGDDAPSRLWPAVRAGALAAALVAIFGSLLAGGDPLFASLVQLPEFDAGIVLSHLFLTAFFAWLVSGWARAALDTAPASAPPVFIGPRLGALELNSSLGALNALFALYVLTQLGWFFGGERFLHERTGLTAASYAREGFFQMVLVVALVLPVLLATRALLAPDRRLARRHTLLSVPIVVLLGLMIVSSALRMRLYVHYYGLTTDRFYPMAFMAWLGVVLAWLAVTVLRGHGERFVAGVLVSAGLLLAGLDAAAPDAIIARVNVARAASAPSDPIRRLDLRHLATLSGEAVPLAVQATLVPPRVAGADAAHDRCAAAFVLLDRWGPESPRAVDASATGAWRSWNAGTALGIRVVGANAGALLRVRHESCTTAELTDDEKVTK